MAKSYASAQGRETPARKKQDGVNSDSAPFVGYVNHEMDDNTKKAFAAWFEMGSFWSVFEQAVASGINVSVKRELRSGGFLASATQRAEDSVNAGLVVTARGKDAATAFGRLMFVLDQLGVVQAWARPKAEVSDDRW